MNKIDWKTIRGFYILVGLFCLTMVGINIYFIVSHEHISILLTVILNMLCITAAFGFYTTRKVYNERKKEKLVTVKK